MVRTAGGVGDALPMGATPAPSSRRRQPAPRFSCLTRPLVPRSWDPLLYTCGAAGGIGLLTCLLFPRATELVVFVLLMFFTSSPGSTFLPAASEPILMAFGKLYPPLLLAGLGLIGIALVEWVNYRLFGAVLHAPRLGSVRNARLMRLATTWFNVLPFWTTVFCAFTPFPFWIARTCAVVVRYPLQRFALATVVGRFPRIFLIALLGSALPFTGAQIALGGGALVAILAFVAVRRARRLALSGGLS